MKKKLNCILLIDDDESTNFINKRVVEKSGYSEKCIAVQGGQAALDYLQSKEDGKYPQPDLIFLDINMPAMNGWEFLDEYRKLDKEIQGRIIVVMLTTSLNPDDKEKAKKYTEISGFKNKPLSVHMLEEILQEYFEGIL